MSDPLYSQDGIPLPNLLCDPVTLRASDETGATAITYADAVSGFGGLSVIAFLLDVTSVTFVGGTVPTAALTVYVQRTPDGGAHWDDLLSLKTAALTAGQTVQHVGEYVQGLVAIPTPAALQTGAGTPAFAQRGNWISDSLRVGWFLTLANSPTSAAVTFSVTARGRS